MANDYRSTQGAVTAALVADLQARAAGLHKDETPYIQLLAEEVGVSDSAFTVEGIREFYKAYRLCYQRAAPDNRPVLTDEVLVEMEKVGASPVICAKWQVHLAQPLHRPLEKVVRGYAQVLIDADVGQTVTEILGQWQKMATDNPMGIRDELVLWANALLDLAGGSSIEHTQPSDIVAEEDARGYQPPITTGWKRLDAALARGGKYRGGIHTNEGDLWVVGAPSGHGKSSMACNLAVNMAKQGLASIYITWEMSKIDLVRRMCCNLGNIPWEVMLNPTKFGAPEQQARRQEAVEAISRYLRIYERPESPEQIGEVIRRHRMEFGDALKIVLIDHIGISKEASQDNSWRTLETLVYSLKKVARRERVAIIMFSQLPPGTEQELKDNNKATGVDFRGSRGIRNGVDVALLLCRHNGKNPDGSLMAGADDLACIQLSKDRRFGYQDWFVMHYDYDHYRYEEVDLTSNSIQEDEP